MHYGTDVKGSHILQPQRFSNDIIHILILLLSRERVYPKGRRFFCGGDARKRKTVFFLYLLVYDEYSCFNILTKRGVLLAKRSKKEQP